MVCATSKCSDQPAQSDQNICESLDYSMTVKLLNELSFRVSKPKKEAAQAHLSQHLSKCLIVGNLISWLICQ